jgi:hypothetical protein
MFRQLRRTTRLWLYRWLLLFLCQISFSGERHYEGC